MIQENNNNNMETGTLNYFKKSTQRIREKNICGNTFAGL
jgi:hypothetical protein